MNIVKHIKLYLAILLFSGCMSVQDNDSIDLSGYANEIQNYDCKQIKDELSFLQTHISSIDGQLENNSFDSFMEGFVSFGIYSKNGTGTLKNGKKKFEKKLELIITKGKKNNCNVKD